MFPPLGTVGAKAPVASNGFTQAPIVNNNLHFAPDSLRYKSVVLMYCAHLLLTGQPIEEFGCVLVMPRALRKLLLVQ
jgi:hypothetical protein